MLLRMVFRRLQMSKMQRTSAIGVLELVIIPFTNVYFMSVLNNQDDPMCLDKFQSDRATQEWYSSTLFCAALLTTPSLLLTAGAEIQRWWLMVPWLCVIYLRFFGFISGIILIHSMFRGPTELSLILQLDLLIVLTGESFAMVLDSFLDLVAAATQERIIAKELNEKRRKGSSVIIHVLSKGSIMIDRSGSNFKI